MKLNFPSLPEGITREVNGSWTFDYDDPNTVNFMRCLYHNWIVTQQLSTRLQEREIIAMPPEHLPPLQPDSLWVMPSETKQ